MDAVPPRTRCERCKSSRGVQKWSYESEYDAWKMIGKIIRSNGYTDAPNRVYACPYGHGFHMASKPERQRGYTV